jgi:hypothetical protein
VGVDPPRKLIFFDLRVNATRYQQTYNGMVLGSQGRLSKNVNMTPVTCFLCEVLSSPLSNVRHCLDLLSRTALASRILEVEPCADATLPAAAHTSGG